MSGLVSPRAFDLGTELRGARLRVGLRQKDVAKLLKRHPSHISRWEAGKLPVSEADTSAMLALYEVTGEERDRLLAMAREAADPNWVTPGMGRNLATVAAREKVSRRIVDVAPLLVPGLCQTEGYARSIMIGAGVAREHIDQRVQGRLNRQRVLSQANPPEYWPIIGEHALRWPPCSRTIMTDQLRHLLILGKRPNVKLHILPLDSGYTAALEGSFALVELPSGELVIQQDGYRVTTILTDGRVARDYETSVKAIHRETMGTEDSAALIGTLLNEWE